MECKTVCDEYSYQLEKLKNDLKTKANEHGI